MNPAYRPMLATLVNEPFDDKAWIFEIKWDGFRLITEKRGDRVKLWSRNGIDVSLRYAVLLPALQKIEGSCVMDGEICALDAQSRSRFQLLQNANDFIFPRRGLSVWSDALPAGRSQAFPGRSATARASGIKNFCPNKGVSLLLSANGTCDARGKEKSTAATHYLTESLGAAEKSVKERYEYLCLIRSRSSKNSMNSAKTQHPIKTTAIDVTVQFMSLSSIAMPSRRTLYYRQAGKAFNDASRITPAL